jgi:hypothetical protein
MIKKHRKIINLFICLMITCLGILFFPKHLPKDPISLDELISPTKENIETKPIAEEKITIEQPIEIPSTKIIEVPFLSQAPLGNWDQLHEDACEEASLLMLNLFYDRTKSITKDKGEKELHALIDWEAKNGYENSITLEQLNIIAQKYFKLLSGRVKPLSSADDLKKEIARGRPVIVPAAGKVLPNPYFRNGGPIYHMLVIKGYDETSFISNDPGTVTKGEGLKYTCTDLLKSTHDWDPTNILNGQKAYLVFEK